MTATMNLGIRALLTWAVVFCCLVAWRHEVLHDPPFQDQSGAWQEATYLARHDFDIYRLRYVERHWTEHDQGARNYMTSIVPSFWAALIRVSRSPEQTLLMAHLANIAFASVAITATMTMTSTAGSTALWLAVGAALATTPVFRVQIDMIGLETPMVAMGVLAVAAVVYHRFPLAMAASALSFLAKPTGALTTAVVLGYAMLVAIGGPASNRARGRRAAIVSATLLFAEAAIVAWGGAKFWSVHDNPVLALFGLTLAPLICPDLLILLAATILLFLIWQWRAGFDAVSGKVIAPGQPVAAATLSLTIVALLVLSVTQVLFIARYLTLGAPFLLVALALSLVATARPLAPALMGFLALFNLANGEGEVFPSLDERGADVVRAIPDIDARSTAFIERSGEYRRELFAEQEVCRAIDELDANVAIFGTNPYSRLIPLPEIGYVRRSIDFRNARYAEDALRQLEIIRFDPTRASRSAAVIWDGITRVTMPPPGKNAKHLVPENSCGASVFLWPLEESTKDLYAFEEAYLDDTTKGPWPVTRLEKRASLLFETGRFDRLAHEEDKLRAKAGDQPHAQKVLDEIERQVSASQALTDEVADLRRLDPWAARAITNLSANRLLGLDLARELAQMGEAPPRLDRPWLDFDRVVRLIEQGGNREALVAAEELSETSGEGGAIGQSIAAFLRAASGQDANGDETSRDKRLKGDLLRLSVRRLIQQGEFAKALELAKTASPEDRNRADYWTEVAIANGRLGRLRETHEALTKAETFAPRDAEIKRRLAAIAARQAP